MAFVIDPDLLGLVDEVALVTGGGGAGMGSRHCVPLARAGCHIVVVDVNETTGRRTVGEVQLLGRKAFFVQADVRRPPDVAKMVEAALGAFGRLDVAVNHVGESPSDPRPGVQFATPFLDMTEDSWDDVIQQNLTATIRCCQKEALAMIANGTPGRIINVASSSGIVGAPNVAVYGAAKAGVIHLTKSLSMEFAQYGIRVNCIVPGTHLSEATKRILADPSTPESRKQFWALAAKAPPLGRLGEPSETAGLAVFFASKLSSYVTGHALMSDGGIAHTTARPPVGLEMTPKAVEALRKP